MRIDWTIFDSGEARVAVPGVPLIMRLRRIVDDGFYDQPPLRPLKAVMDVAFFAGPGLILLALYMPSGGGLLVVGGLLFLALASLYWFAPHWLCRIYLQRKGFRVARRVEAETFAEALSR